MSYSGLVYSEVVPQASIMASTKVNLKNMDDPLVCWRQPYENCTRILDALLPSASSLFGMGEGSRKIMPQYGIFLVLQLSK